MQFKIYMQPQSQGIELSQGNNPNGYKQRMMTCESSSYFVKWKLNACDQNTQEEQLSLRGRNQNDYLA